MRRLDCAGIEVRFHDDRDTGKHIGVKFTDGDITVNGSKIDRHFTYRRLDSLFELNRKQSQGTSPVAKPKVVAVGEFHADMFPGVAMGDIMEPDLNPAPVLDT